ncbi:MAG TPA: glycosyltransferase [Jatrophihabitans sp.]|jgi:trehalose synthase|nr:glycosyltransferase [Jatrophihabitans sp.]
MQPVDVTPLDLDRLAGILPPQRAERLHAAAERARGLLAGRVVWNLNSTARGGGVAEMLRSLLAYGRGAGVDTRWIVVDGDPEFFAITKRLHNRLHGASGDGGPLDAAEHAHYRSVLADNLPQIAALVRPGDLVLLHDPQTAGLGAGLAAAGANVIWRCHIGADVPTTESTQGWEFLRPYLDGARGFVFSRRAYAPPWLPADRIHVIAPSIDPFSLKNVDIGAADVAGALGRAGLLAGPPRSERVIRSNGDAVAVRRHDNLLIDGPPPPEHVRLVVQVSRWDRLKDMTGVLRAFVDSIDQLPPDVHLMLVGPDVSGVADDPEGAAVLAECIQLKRACDAAVRERIHLATLPMDDTDENAVLVNALQRHAAVITQKSLVEGFGLTVTEAMWKARPVVASAVGGIQDQIIDGRDGVLLTRPDDLPGFAAILADLLGDQEAANRLGAAARARVRDQFLGDRHLEQYVDLFASLGTPTPA